MKRSIVKLNRYGQTLLEIVVVLVLFALFLAGASALFHNSTRDVIGGRKLIDAARIGENRMENVQAASWNQIGEWITQPHEETLDGFRVVRSAENVAWSGTGFVTSNPDTGYRLVTVSVFPPLQADLEPYRWVRLFVNP